METKLIALSIALALGGCSATPMYSEHVEDSYKASKANSEFNIETKVDNAEALLEITPDWFLEPVLSDDTGIYGKAMAEDSELYVSTSRARTLGSFEISRTINQKLSGSEVATSSRASRFFVDNFTSSTLTGVETVRSATRVHPKTGQFVTFVLVKYPYKQFNLILQNRLEELQDEQERAEINETYKRLMQKMDATPQG